MLEIDLDNHVLVLSSVDGKRRASVLCLQCLSGSGNRFSWLLDVAHQSISFRCLCENEIVLGLTCESDTQDAKRDGRYEPLCHRLSSGRKWSRKLSVHRTST